MQRTLEIKTNRMRIVVKNVKIVQNTAKAYSIACICYNRTQMVQGKQRIIPTMENPLKRTEKNAY